MKHLKKFNEMSTNGEFVTDERVLSILTHKINDRFATHKPELLENYKKSGIIDRFYLLAISRDPNDRVEDVKTLIDNGCKFDGMALQWASQYGNYNITKYFMTLNPDEKDIELSKKYLNRFIDHDKKDLDDLMKLKDPNYDEKDKIEKLNKIISNREKIIELLK